MHVRAPLHGIKRDLFVLTAMGDRDLSLIDFDPRIAVEVQVFCANEAAGSWRKFWAAVELSYVDSLPNRAQVPASSCLFNLLELVISLAWCQWCRGDRALVCQDD